MDTAPYPLLRLKPGKETLLSKRHPWLFSGALAQAPEHTLVRVADASQVERAVALGADAWVDNDVHIVAAAGRLALTLAA